MIDRTWALAIGLKDGQMRGGNNKLTHNSGWYNKAGEKIGWGDLGKKDISAVLATLPPDEVFIVLSEQNSFWRFVTKVGVIGAFCETTPNVNCPGPEYVREHAMLIVKRNTLAFVTDFKPADISKFAENYAIPGAKISVISPEEAQAFIDDDAVTV